MLKIYECEFSQVKSHSSSFQNKIKITFSKINDLGIFYNIYFKINILLYYIEYYL